MTPPKNDPLSQDFNLLLAEIESASTSADSDSQVSRLATLVGFTEPSTFQSSWDTYNLSNSEVNETAISESETSDDPYTVKTVQPIWANPFAKAGIVGIGTFAIMLVVGLFFNGLWLPSSNKGQTSSTTESSKANQDPLVATKSVGDLKTELALGRQAKELEDIKAASRGKASEPSKAAKPSPLSKQITAPQAVSAPSQPPAINPSQSTDSTPSASYSPSAPASAASISPAPESNPAPIPVPASNPPVRDRSLPSSTTTPPDPTQQWLALSKLGSYGQISSTTTASNSPSAVNPELSTDKTQSPSEINPSPVGKSLALGTKATGVLITPVIWSSESGSDKTENHVVIQTAEPLVATDEKVLFPEKTALLVKVQSVTQSGLVQMYAVKAVYTDNGKQTEINLPEGAFSILAPGKKPLIAEQYQRGSKINLGLSILEGISQSAGIFNRQRSSTTISGAGSTIVTQDNPKPNIPAELLSGMTQNIVQQIMERNQQTSAEKLQRSDARFIAADTKVEIVINQPTQILVP